MRETNARGFSITSLQLAFGVFAIVIGTLILVAPYHFSGPSVFNPSLEILSWERLELGA